MTTEPEISQEVTPSIYITHRFGSAAYPYVDPTTTILSSNGITGNGIIHRGVTSSQYYSKGCIGILHLRNNDVQTFSGWLRDGNDPNITDTKLKIIMEGTDAGVQKILGNYSIFTGGVEVRGGKFEIARYSYSDATITTDSSASHGNLTMLGGRFKFSPGDGITSAAFGFDKLEYADGIIWLNINQDGADMIKLHNGTITALDDFTGKVFFEFDGNVELLLDNYVKIVDWTQKSELGNNNFYADDYGMNKAVFDVRDDGLYVKYSAIPEPATCAAILGIFCLAIAAWRHRK